ncbi:5'-3' exonuclease H3TH domain-containing protein [Rhodococcus sp. X156]|uniref:5'-3' exonuclease n=1 Tax=Rhodococcus sp. X156 TaxID=2499145 RepID=UPI000FD98195|nr:5'-3' exonuclease H3TH domain-containing protein [Rhodococcus sp. X156]
MTRTLMLLDGASLWFRAFHGVPESLTSPDGRPVNAVRGFTDMVATLITRTQPDRLAVCLDLDWRPAFRVAAVPSYKAHRVAEERPPGQLDAEEVPDQLAHQVPVIMDLLSAAGIATAGAQGLEADDVLGTLAAQESRDAVVVVSGDRDLLQVVSDDPVPVRVIYVGRGLAKAEVFGPEDVAERYGVPVERAGAAYAEMATLRGDASDGLPGVAGIGAKTASQLLLTYKSMDALRAAAADEGSGMARASRSRITAAADYLDAALPVVQVVRDADVELSKDDELPNTPARPEELSALAEQWGVESSVARLVKAMAALQR